MNGSAAAHWAALDRHFAYHRQQVDRFRHAGRAAVRLYGRAKEMSLANPRHSLHGRLWSSGTASCLARGRN